MSSTSSTLEALLKTAAPDAASDDAAALLLTVQSPALGQFRAAVAQGDLVQPGQRLGRLTVLSHRIDVVLPRAAGGPLRVAELTQAAAPVDYAAVVMRLMPLTLGDGADASAALRLGRDPALADLPDNAQPIPAPIDGQFYSSPSPDDPAFVQEGDRITPGQIIGLIEVMKFFYEIRFESPGFEQGAEVVRVLASDGQAVEAGAAIAYVVPVS